ncbi:MAG: outer membrane beta-barrel family protein [Bacteroidales bacterium]|nr:outer membrane beta-barrel family protein [Bacteroidales bacterium]
MSALVGFAQFPGGGPPPGGRPPGGRPPAGRFPGGDRQWDQQNMNRPEVKQKKKVREGDTFLVTGVLIDSKTSEPLPFVNLAVLDSIDSTFVKGGVTDYDGIFQLNGIPQGPFLLRVSAIGYESFMHPFNVVNNTDLGILKLDPGAITLDAVVVTAEKPLYAMDGEKLVYNVSEDPSIQTGTTEDALQNAPGVEVDVEGNITLRGVSSIEIWINDKPSKLTEENLKTYLQTLPANAIARIETITNPSAKYATEAEAVINIVTSTHIKSNQFISFGVNGSNQPFVSPWVSYMWKKEKLSINLFASGRFSDRDNTTDTWALQRQDGDSIGTYETTWADTTAQTDKNRNVSGNIFMNINYEIDSTSEISFDAGGFYNFNGTKMLRSQRQTYYFPDSIPEYSELITDTTRSKTDANNIFGHFGIDYTKKFDEMGHNLRIGFNSRISHNASEQWYNRLYDTYTDLNEHRYLLTDQNSYGFSLDVRYNRPYSENGELSYGLRADHQQTDNRYDRYNDSLGVVLDSLRAYHFKGNETNATADVNWTHRWGGFTLSTGLGVGADRVYYNYISTMPFADDSTMYFLNVIPSIHLTYRTQNMHNFKLNYAMRMAHPGETQLSTYRRYGENDYSTGNPNGLKNTYTHNMEAGWQKYFDRFGNIGVEAYGRLSTNEISNLTDSEYDDYLDRVVSYSIPYNLGNSWRYGTSLNMTYRPSGFFNVRLYANVYNYGYHMEYDRQGIHQVDENDMWSWSLRVNAWWKIFNKYQLTMSANYNSPTISLMSERKARYSLNVGARTDFFNRKMSVFVNIRDIFNWGAQVGSGSSNTNPYYLTDSTNKMVNSRYISVGVTFRFGKMELEKRAKEGDGETGDSLE